MIGYCFSKLSLRKCDRVMLFQASSWEKQHPITLFELSLEKCDRVLLFHPQTFLKITGTQATIGRPTKVIWGWAQQLGESGTSEGGQNNNFLESPGSSDF